MAADAADLAVRLALRVVRCGASDALRYDASQLVLVGDSAGGHVCNAVAHMAARRTGPVLAGQVLVCPGLNYALAPPGMFQYFKVRLQAPGAAARCCVCDEARTHKWPMEHVAFSIVSHQIACVYI